MQRTRIILMIAFIYTFFSCNNEIKYPDGGYAYPTHVEDKDTNFYYYPLKDKLSRKDSFENADDYLTYKAFHEQNFSIKNPTTETIRFFFDGWQELPLCITINRNEITVKKGHNAVYNNSYDVDKLSEIERRQLRIFRRNFPLEQVAFTDKNKHYLDSMTTEYPQLLDVNYYQYLETKTIVPNETPFTYSENKIRFSDKQFEDLVEMINNSGYWKLPFELQCKDQVTDGFVYQLEVSAKSKYNVVRGFSCPSDTSKFIKTCQQIINYAQLDKKINLMWNSSIDTVKLLIQDVQLAPVLPDSADESSKPKHK